MKKILMTCTKRISQLLDREFFRFLIVGGVNTLLGYSMTLFLFYIIGINYKLSQILNFLICFPVAYTLQTMFAFRSRWSWKRLFLYPVSSLPNLIVQYITLIFCVEILGVVEYIAYLISYILPIPIMFFVVKFFVAAKSKDERENTLDNSFLSYLGIYTIFFVIVFLAGFQEFFEEAKSFIWYFDGTKQHFPFLYDYAETLKTVISGKSAFPMWNWQLGFGADTVFSYSYYVLGDLFSILASLFFPLSKMELAYSIMIGARLYFVGFSLLYYCKYMGLREIPSVIGSLMYAFCGQILFWGLRHPFFSNSAIIFPFLALGIEEIFKRKKPMLFILCVAFSAINNYYFLYMNTLGIFVYSIIRFFYYVIENKRSNFIKAFLKVTYYYLIGLSIGAVVFLPSAYGFLNTARVPSIELKSFFEIRDYINMFARFVINDKIPRISLPLIAFPCTLMFLRFQGRFSKSFKVMFFIMTIFVCLPIMHYAFNAMSAQNDRWVYIYIFLLSFNVSYVLNHIDGYEQWKFFIVFFSVLGILFYDAKVVNLTLIILGVICLCKDLCLRHPIENSHANYFQIGILILVTLNLIVNVDTYAKESNLGKEFKEFGSVLSEYEDDQTAIVNSLRDVDLYRTDYDDKTDNKGLVNNFNGTHIYNSIVNKNLIAFYDDHNLRTKPHNSAYMGLDNITGLTSLLNVKYYVAKEKDKHAIPYGFKEKVNEKGVVLYENQYVLPIGFIYDEYILHDSLQEKSTVDKVYQMMNAAIVEEDILNIPKKKYQEWGEVLDFKVIRQEGVKINDNKIEVLKKNGSITLQVNGAIGKETFLEISRIYYEKDNKDFKLTVETDKIKKSKETRSMNNTYYIDNRNYLYNLGVSQEDTTDITISFNQKGSYKYEDLEIIGVSMNKYKKCIKNLNKNTLQEIKLSTNKIQGKIQASNKSILFLSIPYTKGWQAYIDGKKVETFPVNTAFTGVVIDKGQHEVYLKYTTPFLHLGALISIIGILILLIGGVVGKHSLKGISHIETLTVYIGHLIIDNNK